MILSYEHQYIFMHCRKTAGSSIAVSLARNLGPKDIFVGGIEEAMDLGINPPRRVVAAALRENPVDLVLNRVKGNKQYAAAVSKHAKKRFSRTIGKKPQHVAAQVMQTTFPVEWSKFFKFCVVRNPYDLVVSDYYWRTSGVSNPPSFEHYMQALERCDSLDGIVPLDIHSNWPIYTIDDEIAVDAVYHYEQLPHALETGLKGARIPFEGIITKAKSSQRSARSKNYTEFHTSLTREIVERLYEKEIAAFGYRFGD
ncbi:sulfotransferase family 2 domain-containing protein [uncultured Parasphingorhabdus sp.]|uniref:sulfotransferase family 2 domain-containing protein n=1 Tax=uncultured Parasphingorhabdus sp. TaxID=2709694 RepID=UPI002AA87CF9|nr:sulfotransferase family 2 domain-containing protein [uncultured Parasphingorhabdus sp.]